MSLDENKFISADGHVMEPADLWVTRMDKRFRERAPRVESREDADYLLIEGLAAAAVTDLIGTMANEKAEGKPILARNHNRYADVRAGALDPLLRLEDQDLDNLSAEVVYPNDAMFLYAAPDLEYRRECLRAYNSWLAEYCAAAPKPNPGRGDAARGRADPMVHRRGASVCQAGAEIRDAAGGSAQNSLRRSAQRSPLGGAPGPGHAGGIP